MFVRRLLIVNHELSYGLVLDRACPDESRVARLPTFLRPSAMCHFFYLHDLSAARLISGYEDPLLVLVDMKWSWALLRCPLLDSP